jgi:hypothetical protein
MTAMLARLGSPAIVGQYALGVAVSVPLLVLMHFRRRESGATDIRITSLVLALLGIAAVGFLDHTLQDRMALLLVVLAESVEWVADLYAGRREAVSLALHGVLPIAVLGPVFRRSGHLGTGLLAVVIVRLLVLFCYDFRRERREALAGDREMRVARLAGCVPCYFIAHMLGFRALGIFAAIACLLPAATARVQAFGQAAFPKMVRSYAEGDSEGYGRMCARMAGIGLMLGLCGVAGALSVGPWVLGRLFGAEYAGQPALLLALSAVAGVSFVATLLGYALTAGRCGHERMPLEIIAVAFTALACVALVPRTGVLGAASAAGFGLLVQVVGQMWMLGNIVRRPRLALMELLKES